MQEGAKPSASALKSPPQGRSSRRVLATSAMLRTVETVTDEQGNVRLLQHVTLSGARKALVTILEETPASSGGSSARAPANPVAGIHPPPAPPPPPRTPPPPRPPTAVAIDLPPSRPDIAATVVP